MGRLIDADEVDEAIYKSFEDIQFYDGTGYDIYSDSKEIIDNVPTVEAIPKADYEARLKADLVANYIDIQAEIRRFMYDVNPSSSESDYACNYMINIIQQKINELKAESEEK